MKLDNPKLTAYVLGELSPVDRAAFENEIRSDREIAAEVDETKEVARIVREGLRGEPAGHLADHQRDAIFREARMLAEEARAVTDPAEAVFAPVIVPRGSLWNRPGPWQAIAACAVAGFAAYALFVNLGHPSTNSRISGAGEIVVPVPLDGGAGGMHVAGPNLSTPPEHSKDILPPVAGVDPGSMLSSEPKINSVKPDVKIDAPKRSISSPQESVIVKASEAPGAPGARSSARPLAQGKNGVKDWTAGASIGAKNPDSAVTTFVQDRLQEAKEFSEGSTYEDFSRVFQPVPGAAGQYEMIRLPSIKVDATFVPGSTQTQGAKPAPDARLKSISKPYLD